MVIFSWRNSKEQEWVAAATTIVVGPQTATEIFHIPLVSSITKYLVRMFI